jgi:hypothetical protein
LAKKIDTITGNSCWRFAGLLSYPHGYSYAFPTPTAHDAFHALHFNTKVGHKEAAFEIR